MVLAAGGVLAGEAGGAKETAHMGLPINRRRRAVALELLARSPLSYQQHVIKE
jgi:hypothetical protein